MAEEPDLELGAAGASGRREYERAWASGAAGEEQLAAFLIRRCPEAIVLHDRRLPQSRANIDHIAVAPSGVWVIDAKRYKGKIEVRKPLFRDAKLMIGGRDKTKLVAGLARQAEAVQSTIAWIAPGVPVQACFCFVNPEGQSGGAKLPLLRTLSVSGYPLLYPAQAGEAAEAAGGAKRRADATGRGSVGAGVSSGLNRLPRTFGGVA